MTLYPNTKFLSREHYDEIVRLATGCKTALEFGPGATTLALIEAGCERIHTFDHVEKWADHYRREFAAYPQVSVGEYVNLPRVAFVGGEGLPTPLMGYDIAIVDGPQGDRTRTPLAGQESCSRLNTLMIAVERAPLVILHDANRRGETNSLRRLSRMGYQVSLIPSERGLAVIRRMS